MKHLRNVLVFLILLSASSCKKCCRFNEDSDKCIEDVCLEPDENGNCKEEQEEPAETNVTYIDENGQEQTASVTVYPSLCDGNGEYYMGIKDYCELNGASYDIDVALKDKSIEDLIDSRVSSNDADGDGVADYIQKIKTELADDAAKDLSKTVNEEVANRVKLEIATEVKRKLDSVGVTNASSVVLSLDALVSVQIYEALDSLIQLAVIEAVNQTVTDETTDVDYVLLRETIEEKVAVLLDAKLDGIVGETVKSTLYTLIDLGSVSSEELTPAEINAIAVSTSGNVGKDVKESTVLKDKISNDIVVFEREIEKKEIEAQNEMANANAELLSGLCPEGTRIPTDADMKFIEKYFLGIPDAELNLEGKEHDRGASVNAKQKWHDYLGVIPYAGYVDRNGLFVEKDAVDVFWTSTAGKDINGNYIWIRYVDTVSHNGIMRQKHYMVDGGPNAKFSVRCVSIAK